MNSPIRFNAVVFEEAIHRQFADAVMGYAFVIADENGLPAKVSGGYAQAPGDLHTYNHNDEIFYSAIFAHPRPRPQVLRHDMSAAGYQAQFEEWVGQGFALQMVTGAASGNRHCYAAVWQQ